MVNYILNPFIYGKPVPTGRFIGRQRAVRTVFSRLYNGESTAIVGEPHIGKSSLLNYIADEDTRRDWLTQVYDTYAFAEFDCHLMPANFGHADFWKQVLSRVTEQIPNQDVAREAEVVIQADYSSFTLERLFRLMARHDYRVALAIDEFDTLLNHPLLGNAEFLAALRSLATRTDGLAIITASRLSVSQMNRRSQVLQPTGSPFFNNMTEVRLLHLKYEEAQSLIVKTLKAGGDNIAFEGEDLDLLFSLAGRHPFLLQMAAASLFDAKSDVSASVVEVHVRTEELFNQRAAAHFDDVWRTLDEAEQRTILMLAMLEYAEQAQIKVLDESVFQVPTWFEADLQKLCELNIAKQDGQGTKLVVGGFCHWLVANVVWGTHYDMDFSRWLETKKIQNLLSAQDVQLLSTLADQLLAKNKHAKNGVPEVSDQIELSSSTVSDDDQRISKQQSLARQREARQALLQQLQEQLPLSTGRELAVLNLDIEEQEKEIRRIEQQLDELQR